MDPYRLLTVLVRVLLAPDVFTSVLIAVTTKERRAYKLSLIHI